MIVAPSQNQFQFMHNICWTARAAGLDQENFLHWVQVCWDAQEKAIEEDDKRRATSAPGAQ